MRQWFCGVGPVILSLFIAGQVWSQGPEDLLAPGYPPSQGGGHGFEYIAGAWAERMDDSTMRFQVNILIVDPTGCVSGKECPEYDDSPQYVNVWADWNGDKEFSGSELVMAEAGSGYREINYAGIMTFWGWADIPENAVPNTYFRVMNGWQDNPNKPTTKSWTYGDVKDFPLTINSDIACTIEAKRLEFDQLYLTWEDIELSATLEDDTYYEIVRVDWRAEGLLPVSGNPVVTFFPPGRHGRKTLTATIQVRHRESGLITIKEEILTFNVYFVRDDDDDGDGAPNWFKYWKNDGAVEKLNLPYLVFDKSLPETTAAVYKTKLDKIFVGQTAAEFSFNWSANGINFGGALGIDALAETLHHENMHREIGLRWDPGGEFEGKQDSDFELIPGSDYNWDDDLPDSFEISESGTSPDMVDTYDLATNKNAPYKYYGDNEYYVSVQALGKKGIPSRDWAYPGKQSDLEVPLVGPKNEGFFVELPENQAAVEGSKFVCLRSNNQERDNSLPDIGVATEFGEILSVVELGQVDDDGDSLIDRIQVEVELSLPLLTDYGLAAYVADGEGDVFMSVVGTVEAADLNAGKITLDLDARLISQYGKEGPFKIDTLQLSNSQGHLVVTDHQTDVLTLSELPAEAMERHPIRLGSEPASFVPVDFSSPVISTQDVIIPFVSDIEGTVTVTAYFSEESSTIFPKQGIADFVVEEEIEVTVGEQEITLSISGWDIWMTEYYGYIDLSALTFSGPGLPDGSFTYRDVIDDFFLNGLSYEPEGLGISTVNNQAYAIDANQDGISEGVYFWVEVYNSEDDGLRYYLSARLEDEEGNLVSTASNNMYFERFTNRARLFFDGSDIRKSEKNGPYYVRQLKVVREDTGVLENWTWEIASTPEYSWEVFFEGSFEQEDDLQERIQGIERLEADKALNLTVPINILNLGQMITEAQILDATGQEVLKINDKILITETGETNLALKVQGSDILSQGYEGPFTLAYWIAYHSGNPENQLVIAEDLQLDYEADSFATAKLGIVEMNTSGAVEFDIELQSARSYRIEYSYNLSVWVTAATGFTGSGENLTWNAPPELLTDAGAVFFRLVEEL